MLVSRVGEKKLTLTFRANTNAGMVNMRVRGEKSPQTRAVMTVQVK